jgi:hypothetical protein
MTTQPSAATPAGTRGALREYRITFTRLPERAPVHRRMARRAGPIPPLDLTVGPLDDAEIASAVRHYLDADPEGVGYVRRIADVKVSERREHGIWGTVTRQARGGGAPVPVVEFHVMWRPKRGRGRPPVGAPTNLRLTPGLRERLEAARRPGEGVAEAARRLLAVALDPVLPDALARAAAAWDGASAADCGACTDLALTAPRGAAPLCPEHTACQYRADACRGLQVELTGTNGEMAK